MIFSISLDLNPKHDLRIMTSVQDMDLTVICIIFHLILTSEIQMISVAIKVIPILLFADTHPQKNSTASHDFTYQVNTVLDF